MQQEIFNDLGLGTRLRRILEMMSIDVERIYKEETEDFKVRYFPVIYSLYKIGGLSIAQMQKTSGQTHSAVSQTVKQLTEKGYVALNVGKDARSRIVRLTPKGDAMVQALLPSWQGLEATVKEIRTECKSDLLQAVNEFEARITDKSIYQRYQNLRKSKISPEIEYVPFHVKYRQDWFDINHEWIAQNFKMEQADLELLKQPEENILAKGGEIYFALIEGKAVGAAALKHHGSGEYELSKMGVKEEAQRMGIGQKLIEIIIERYQARGGKSLFLETNNSLNNAIKLYQKCGFNPVKLRTGSPYDRADTCMEYVNP